MASGLPGETARGAPPPQRVCPHCARVAYATERRCPYCRRRYRRNILPAIAGMLVVFAALVLGGVYLMLATAGDRLEDRLDDRVERAQESFDRSVKGVEKRLQEDIDRQAGETEPSPTPTPSPTTTPTPSPSPSPTPTPRAP
jgi:hypothetical protein